MVAESIALIYLTASDREGLAVAHIIPKNDPTWMSEVWMDHGGSKRILVGLLLVLATVANATIGPPIEIDTPRMISAMFKSGDSAVFGFNSTAPPANDATGRVESLQLIVATKFYDVPLADCRALRDIHVETAGFVEFESTKRSEGTFTFTFQMGDESTRKLGQLPRIQISYSKGRLQSETITSGSLTSPLCFAPL